MRALRTFGIVTSACFGFTVGIICVGIIVQDTARKHREADKAIANAMERTRFSAGMTEGPASRRQAWPREGA